MRVEQRVEGEEERLSTEELHALRARLFGETSQSPKPISTVADLAEFLGRPPEDVWRQLDRLRAEKAFAVSAPSKPSQLPLLGIAVVLLGAAYGIYKITPRKLSEAEIDDRIAQLQRERVTRPKKIHYPILKTVEVQAPARGFSAIFNGVLTSTTFRGSDTVWPGTAAETEKRLSEALRRAYDDARKREMEAPQPPQPLKQPANLYTPLPSPDRFILNVSAASQSMMPEISTDPLIAGPQLDVTAKEMVRAMQMQQDRVLNELNDNPYGVAPPPGFMIQTQSGMSSRSNGSGNLGLRPIDAIKVRNRLDLSLRDQIRRTLEPDMPVYGTSRPYVPGPEMIVKITGPLRPIEVALPLKAGGKYPTAADAMRAYERIFTQVLDEAEKQIREINAGKG